MLYTLLSQEVNAVVENNNMAFFLCISNVHEVCNLACLAT